MVAQFVVALERPVSRVRLENYRPANASDLDMVVSHFYNLERSEALYPSLQAFEIALRNSIHLTLSAHFQTSFWFDDPGILPRWQQNQINEARKKLDRDGKPHDADRIVAELHFGFWHSMRNSPFERALWRPNRSALVGHVFPYAPGTQRNRQKVWVRCDQIRIIRNRVMHYEPIWYRARLAEDHASILETLRWISPEMHETIAMCDRFPMVLGGGRASIEQRISTEIGRRYPTR